jgi:hypothetical protein
VRRCSGLRRRITYLLTELRSRQPGWRLTMPSGQHPTSHHCAPAQTLSATEPLEIYALREENRQLRDLVAQLSKLVVGNVLAQKERTITRSPPSHRCS